MHCAGALRACYSCIIIFMCLLIGFIHHLLNLMLRWLSMIVYGSVVGFFRFRLGARTIYADLGVISRISFT